MDHFETFGLPRRLAIDADELQRRFYELSRRFHPDVHQGGSPDDQQRAMDVSARVNTAYRTLRDPISRVEYLIALEDGRASGDRLTTAGGAPPEMLAEMFEIQEALETAKAGGLDDAARAELRESRDRLEGRRRAEEAQLTGVLAPAWDEASPDGRRAVLDDMKRTLARRAYLRTVVDDLTAALGESDETHVTHHRH